MGKKDFVSNFVKVKGKAKEISSTVGDSLVEGGKRIKDSKVLEKVSIGAKSGIDKISEGVKSGAEIIKNAGDKEPKESLDDMLKEAIDNYNATYTMISDNGTRIYNQRERSVDLIINIENLINSIANHPKEFDKEITEIKTMRQSFTDTCEFARQELEAAQKSALGAGAGIAGGTAIAAVAPSVAMWVATTFGTASTGTAISALSGAAAQSAALAWLGGGALTAGGGGMVAGNALLAMAGPIGWSIAGATLLTSVVLFANKKMKLNMQKKEEIEAVLKNIESLKEIESTLGNLLKQTTFLREQLNIQYNKCLGAFEKDFMSLTEEMKMSLGALVNETKALASLLNKGV